MVMLSELALGRWWGRGWYPTFNPGPIHNIPCLFLWGKEEEQGSGKGREGGRQTDRQTDRQTEGRRRRSRPGEFVRNLSSAS